MKKNKNAVNASQILERLLGNLGLGKKLENYKFITHWEEIVGSKLAKVSKVDRIERKTLYITVKDSIWSNELSLEQNLIIERVNMFMSKDNQIKSIRFFIGKI